MMSGQTVAGFRDSVYLYYPLFKWIDAQWAAGEVPLWNPYCNFGIPVVGDGTSCVFYPGKLIFFCRFLSYPSRYGIFLAIHFPLAAAGTYWFARSLKAGQAGATLAAFSYSLGGSVLFQVNNVVYLVSAAWLPLALGCVWKMVRTGDYKWAVGAGASCAMMILGGDPQMVYHVGLIAAATVVCEGIRRRSRRFRGTNLSLSRHWRWFARPLAGLALMIIATTLLSFVQLWPTYQWSRFSERMQSDSVVNIYGAIGRLSTGADGPAARSARESGNDLHGEESVSLTGPVLAGSVQHHGYQFSLPPWSLTELLWPNASGKLFPIYRRWTDGFPGADRVWVPSIYAGLLTILLAIGGVRLWGARRQHVWLTRIGLFFAVASFGWYGAVWLINELLPARQQINEIGPQVGGIYWAMVMLLPKYFAFRYPAKLFVIASLCIAVLAGLQFRKHRFRFLDSWMISLGIATMVGGGVLVFLPVGFFQDRIPPDVLFGPFDQPGCVRDLAWSLFHAVSILILATLAYRFLVGKGVSVGFIGLSIVAITAFDLTIANRWMLAELPASVFESNTQKMDELRQELSRRQATLNRPLSVYRSRIGGFEPIAWSKTSSATRLEDVLLWQKETLFPKHHFQPSVRLIGSFSSIWPTQYEWLLSNLEFDRFSENEAGPLICDVEMVVTGEGDDYRTGLREFRRYMGQSNIEPSEFRTDNFALGAWISGISWLALMLGSIMTVWKRAGICR